MTHRRDFLRTTIGGALAGGFAPLLDRLIAQPAAPLDILVLGGTGFIGPHLVRDAVARGHHVTIFTRGRHDAELPPEVARLIGDRNGQLDALRGKRWDAVIDDSATNPDWVAQSSELLRDATGAYLFTSSTGVFYPYLKRGLDESVPIHYDAVDPKDESEIYGVAKAKCEQRVMKVFGERGIVVRPTYIVGPGDTSDRFPYWPVRLAKGGEVLAPGKRDDPVQFIDVRDLAEFMVHLLETKAHGIYDVVGPRKPMTAREFYEQAVAIIRPDAKMVYVDGYEFLVAHKIDEAIPWAMLKGNDFGMMSVKNDKVVAAGLSYRSLATTLKDTLAWWPTVPAARQEKPKFTISPETESAALVDWKARKG